jgi:transcriptional regulator with XRE-family HTH domain
MDLFPTPLDIEIAAKRAGLTMTQVCARANVAFSTWARWKAGTSKMTIDTCAKLANAAKALDYPEKV